MRSAEYGTSLPPALTASAVVDAWRHITRVEIKGAFLFGCSLFVYHVIVFSGKIVAGSAPLYSLIKGFMSDQLSAFALMLAIVVVDRLTGKDVRRRAYAIAVVVCAAIVAPVESLIEPAFESAFSWVEFAKAALYGFFEWLVLGGAATLIYTDRRRAQAALARLRAAELERIHAAKRTLESRLQAMQARVEPQFLFNTLAQVRDLYRTNVARGERMFDELIAYLRAAMPKIRDTSSTVGQELDLVRAYLGIVRVRLGERFAFDVASPGPLAEARMPPMMMLPLVDHAIAHGLERSGAKGTIRITAEAVDGRVRVGIVDSGAGFVPEASGEGIGYPRASFRAIWQRCELGPAAKRREPSRSGSGDALRASRGAKRHVIHRARRT